MLYQIQVASNELLYNKHLFMVDTAHFLLYLIFITLHYLFILLENQVLFVKRFLYDINKFLKIFIW